MFTFSLGLFFHLFSNKLFNPNNINETLYLYDNETTSCDNTIGDGIYSREYRLSNVGIYNWTTTYANDTSGNLNSKTTNLFWNSTSIGTLTVNMTNPTTNFEIN